MERDGHTHLQFLALVGSHRAFPGVFLPSFRMSCQHLCSSDFFFLCVCVCVFPHLSGTLALLLQRLAVQMQMGLHPGWISIVQKYGPIDGIQ
jgi:hypothetical protein